MKTIALLVALSLPSALAQVCTNTVLDGSDPDQGCTDPNTPVCVSSAGVAIGWSVPGQQCVPCVKSEPHNLKPDCGCPATRPRCKALDGSDAAYNMAGVQCVDETDTSVPGDLGIRFNKFAFILGNTPDSGFLPLDADDYPIGGSTGTTLKTETNAISVVTVDDYELQGAQAARYIELVGGPPSQPNSDSTAPYWEELAEVTRVQKKRRNGDSPADLIRLPDLWMHMDIDEVAEAVHDEYPGYHQAKLMEWLWGQGVKLDYTIMPFRSNADFIGMQIRLADINTWATRVVSPINFNVKWTAGRARPEEVAYMIATDELTVNDGVPADLVTEIKSMNLPNATSFTKYPEGSPRHPAWPAMHSAASSASLWLSVVLDLTPAQRCEALRVDYAVSYARTVAGVHYESDNTDGLNLGSEILSEKLAAHLAENYGSDPVKVQEKLELMKFDWTTFDSTDCSYSS